MVILVFWNSGKQFGTVPELSHRNFKLPYDTQINTYFNTFQRTLHVLLTSNCQLFVQSVCLLIYSSLSVCAILIENGLKNVVWTVFLFFVNGYCIKSSYLEISIKIYMYIYCLTHVTWCIASQLWDAILSYVVNMLA